ncbi:MAG: hypothetical protein SNH27_06955 [Rikenellaceae bacterium]
MISRLLKMFSGGADSSQNRQEIAMPDVIDKKIATTEIPFKFRADIERLQEFYGSEFKNGQIIVWTLQQALDILPRERKRVDSYTALTKYLHETRGIILKITSNKTK